ncbi:MAG: ABC transporter ATP-binding protein [Gammaproteobacteria bacterium]|nr:ABC transporter ATP-binding protein [Gammaproteobacteria bacterium]MDE0455140.1 ABC transporter ATP-binding protein [Gammaproteobacteria bacterium]
MNQPAPHVEYRAVHKRYAESDWVVRDLDLELNRGEFLTLLGPSGSGKTTCLMMLAGFEPPTMGDIRINGVSVAGLPPDKRGIGVVFQNYALFPHMSVGANLAFPLEVRGLSADQRRERVARALELVRLEGYEDRRPNQLSGGQQQRVAIARALVFEPELVLMDEPLGALDRRLREQLQYEIRRIQRQLGVTVLYVTHDQTEAMAMSDRVAVFRAGRIEQVASPEVLYEEPQRPFVASFIGENNLLRGRIVSVEHGVCHVDVGDERIQAAHIGDLAPGSETLVAIRPERVHIAPLSMHYSNEFDAEVEDISFLGDHLRVRLLTCGSSDFIAKIPNIVGHGGILPGDTVRIGWGALDCRALEAEAL